jgi:exodeoxyribonuclease-3
MKITTWNVNGLRAREGQVAEWVAREKPDVLCLQELKATLAQVPVSLGQLEGYHGYWHGNAGGYSGVSLHVRAGFSPRRPRFSHPDFDHEGRMVLASLGQLDVASIYVPNGGKDFPAKMRFLEALERLVRASHSAGRQLVLCGDLNVTLTARDVHETERDEQKLGQTKDERALLAAMIADGLTDVQRTLEPDNGELFSWWAPWRNHRQRNIGWRLDYVLASGPLAARVKSCRVDREFGTSDHGPVTAIFEGALFDPAAVLEGPAQPLPEPEGKKQPKAPQLDLFGNAIEEE